MGKKTKRTGKTEVYLFWWYMEDIKNMMDYFKMKGGSGIWYSILVCY